MPGALHDLLTGAIDFAGLFPPAALSMADAIDEFAVLRATPDAWALGRFVVPISRWSELVEQRRRHGDPADAWPASVLAGVADLDAILHARADTASGIRLESVESRASSAAEVLAMEALVSAGLQVFVEAALPQADLPAFAAALRAIGAGAKIRTGGVTPDAFPTPGYVLAFLQACREAQIRFKATAGLHHALRGDYALTYAPDSVRGTMFGFLNVAVAAALVWHGRNEAHILAVLEDHRPETLSVSATGVSWHGEHLSTTEIRDAHDRFFSGFGSCSFREPVQELDLVTATAK